MSKQNEYSRAIVELFSEKRLSNYSSFEDYLNNIRVSQHFYVELHMIEIGLRNKINTLLLKNLGKNWIHTHKYLLPEYCSKLDEAVDHDNYVANLTFGVWLHILNNHLKIFSNADLSYLFGLSKKQVNRQFRVILTELKLIKNFRNRVFHYEKINNHTRYLSIAKVINKFIKLLDIDSVLMDSIQKIRFK
ncbi:MAG: hypothetical protein QG673_290 [Pseudomonadota bacterium]|nr:hypothetical protein [Pseudomonadota bacterium]